MSIYRDVANADPADMVATYELRVEAQVSALPVFTNVEPITVHYITRRAAWLQDRLDEGWVAELAKSTPGGRPSKRYILRGPAAHETDGAYVTQKVVNRLVDAGLAVRVFMPQNDKTWVFSQARYQHSPLADYHRQTQQPCTPDAPTTSVSGPSRSTPSFKDGETPAT